MINKKALVYTIVFAPLALLMGVLGWVSDTLANFYQGVAKNLNDNSTKQE